MADPQQSPPPTDAARPAPAAQFLAMAVHALTASGLIFALLAAGELMQPAPRPTWVFIWLIIAVLIDAIDGPLARAVDIKRNAPDVNGRKIDDIIDYITFTFVPLALCWRMGWLAEPELLFAAAAAMAGVMLFAHRRSKHKQGRIGFFRGFPNYWNIYAFYAGLSAAAFGPWPATVLLIVLVVLTLAPVRVVYPNYAPRAWKLVLLGGGAAWLAALVAMLPWYPHEVPTWAWLATLIYPAIYGVASMALDHQARRSGEPIEALD